MTPAASRVCRCVERASWKRCMSDPRLRVSASIGQEPRVEIALV